MTKKIKKALWLLLWMGFSCLKATEPLRGDSSHFTIQFPGVPGTQLIDLEGMKGWIDLEATSGFELGNMAIGRV